MTSRAKIFRKNEQKAIELVSSIIHADEAILNKGVFDWLRGGDKGDGVKLRVDAYFPKQKLVVEYNGKQHYESNALMDRRPGRAKQRREYAKRRKYLIPKHGLKLLEIKYDEPLTKENLERLLKNIGIIE